MATDPLQGELVTQGSPLIKEGLESPPTEKKSNRFRLGFNRRSNRFKTGYNLGEKVTNAAFLGPAVIIVLMFAIFPLIVSLYISFSRMQFVQGGVEFNFVGFDNYNKLLNGSQKTILLGLSTDVPPLGWALLAVAAGLLGWGLLRYTRSAHFSL